jgi:Flp pilus assembly protein TadG
VSRQRGSAAIEFVLVIPLVLAVLLAAVEVTVVARTQLTVSQAAREGAREAATSPDPERAVTVVQHYLGPDLGGGARVAVSRDHIVGGRAEVVVTVRHRVAAPFFGGVPIELQGRASMRVER